MNPLVLFRRRGRLRIRRYREILTTLMQYGFGEVVYQTGLGKTLQLGQRIFRRKARAEAARRLWEHSTWERIRMALEALGPTFVKLGQILSNRPDLIPAGLQAELGKLQENVPPFPAHEAIERIESELGKPLRELFRDFREDPVAAASIAQIHYATLLDGEEVAVKVQRPGLEQLVAVDLDILRELAALMERYSAEVRAVGAREIVEEFRKAISQELDFGWEGTSIERFGSQFSSDDSILVPAVYRSHSTPRILTIEFVHGVPLSHVLREGEDVRQNGAAGYDRAEIARRGAELTLKQIFDHGFFHADPHPGNVLVLEDGRLCFLDFGLTGMLTRRELEIISDMLINIIRRNEQKASRAVVRLAGSRDFETAQRIEREISHLTDRFLGAEAGDFSFTGLLAELVHVLVGQGLRLPADLFLLVKALLTMEGVATALDPHFHFTEHARPFAEKLVRERYDPARIVQNLSNVATDYGEILESVPADYRKVVDTIASGRLRLSVDDESIGPLRRTLLQASSSLVFAIVLASLIIGSSLIVHSRVPPLWQNIPVIGLGGFVIAGLVAFWLLVKIIRDRTM